MSALNSVLKTSFTVAYEVSPIFLVGGIAADIPGGILPLAALTENIGIVNGLLHGGIDLDKTTTRFQPVSGGTLNVQDIATYPFLNQATAANAVVMRPNRISMKMTKPASTHNNTYATKPAVFAGLKAAFDNHNQLGGTYTILTPAYFYVGCLMRTFMDISTFSADNKQVQYAWLLDFEQPLLTEGQLFSVLNSTIEYMEKGIKPGKTLLSWASGVAKGAMAL